METTYATLTEALADIAGRSFYESADVIPNDDGTFTVRESHDYADEVTWTYADGIDAGTGALDYSRVHESCEFYETAEHIRYNLGGAVSAIEDERRAVHFEYQAVNTFPTTAEDIADDENGLYDSVVGWALIAYYA